ncbi:hypothetical protein PU634_10405 [Oceanimonas pelagia]|uniref:Uncharacterized protein n=1 Tax=Oceanimonas pelagia TaxID=3028314 RepID=A0AA50KMA3_9GAMM|nr:hypothetical protein [Oceanimonas pelagia]WMC09527.1 hypothetical protein PU634_10405 [Oceanimonas pelagia]
MQKLEYQGRYRPAYAGDLSELISDVQFTPYGVNHPPMDTDWGYLHTFKLDQLDVKGWFHVALTPVMSQILDERSIYGGDLKAFNHYHYLELVKSQDGRIYLRLMFRTIIGGYNLMEVREDELIPMLEQAVKNAGVGVQS